MAQSMAIGRLGQCRLGSGGSRKVGVEGYPHCLKMLPSTGLRTYLGALG